MTTELAEALWLLGLLSPGEMSGVALRLLEAGNDNEAMRVLAGLTACEQDEASFLFAQMMQALGKGHLDKESALRVCVQEIARDIVEHRSAPHEGARRIWSWVRDSGVQTHLYDPFIYAASEYEDRPSDRAFFAAEILKEAERVLGMRND